MTAKSKKKVGRPTKLTPNLQDEIVDLLKAGNYIETTCAVVGINKTTFYQWLKRGKSSIRSTKYTIFRDVVTKAMAFAEARLVALITRAAEKNWSAAVWILEHKYPERWGKQNVKTENLDEIEKEIENEVHMSEDMKVLIKKALGIIASMPIEEESSPTKMC
jgi:transposase